MKPSAELIVSNARVLISEFDTFATATGSIDQQTSVASPAGGYAFNLGGLDTNDNTFVVGGILNISGANHNRSAAASSTTTMAAAWTGTDLRTPARSVLLMRIGRVVIRSDSKCSSGLPVLSLCWIYREPQTNSAGGNAGYPRTAVYGGTALGQGSNTGKFNQASVAGSSYAFEATGQDIFSQNSTIAQMAGGFGLNANGTVSGAIALNDLTCISALRLRAVLTLSIPLAV